MLAPFDTMLLIVLVEPVAVKHGVKLGALVSTAVPRSEHHWLSFLLREIALEPVRQTICTNCNVVHPVWPPGLGMGGQVHGFYGCLHLLGLGMDGQVQGGLVLLRLLEVLLVGLVAFLHVGKDEEGLCSENEFLLLNLHYYFLKLKFTLLSDAP